MSKPPRKILYCRCAFAQVVPESTKTEVLERLCESGATFECVADLCEMAARKDERIQKLIGEDQEVKIAACYPRAVKWLFHHADAPFPDDESVEVLNMRESSAKEIVDQLLES